MWTESSESHATLSYESDVDIHGFQLNVSGVDLTDAYDGVLEVQYNDSTQNVIGFSIFGDVLEQGSGSLITFEFIPEVEGASLTLSDVVIAGAAGAPAPLSLTLPDTLEITPCANVDSDQYCDVADDCPLDANDDSDGDGSCDSDDICDGDDDFLDTDEDTVCLLYTSDAADE